MELTLVGRRGEILARCFTEAFSLDSEPGQQSTLRRKTIDHPLFAQAIPNSQCHCRHSVLTGPKNPRRKPAALGMISGHFDDRWCRSRPRLDTPASAPGCKARCVMVRMSAFIKHERRLRPELPQ